MSVPGDFAADEQGRRAREDAVARVGETLGAALAATDVAIAPDAYGLLCSFLPALLDPAGHAAHAALDRGAVWCRQTSDELRAAGAAFAATDDAGARALLPP